MLFAVFLIVIVTASYAILAFFSKENLSSIHFKSVIRNVDNTEEEQAILVAENVNYSGIFNITKLKGLSYTPQGNSSDHEHTVWAQLIDTRYQLL